MLRLCFVITQFPPYTQEHLNDKHIIKAVEQQQQEEEDEKIRKFIKAKSVLHKWGKRKKLKHTGQCLK